MKPTVMIACLLSLNLAGCQLLAGAPAPTPTAAPARTESSPVPALDSNPFPRLANPEAGRTLEVAEYFKEPGSGVSVADVAIAGGVDADGDGALDYTVQGKVELAGLGAHDVEILEQDAPASGEAPDVFTVTDKTTGKAFTFEMASDGSLATIATAEASLSFQVLADEKVSLEGGMPVTLEEAAEQVAQGALSGKVSPHGLALLYAKLMRSPAENPQAYRTQSGFTSVRYLLEVFLYLLLMVWLRGV